MGLPTLNINFATAATQTAERINRGVVAIIVKESTAAVQNKLYKLSSAADIPAGLSANNKKYIASAFTGNAYGPRSVIVVTIASTNYDYDDALDMLAAERFDWLVAAWDCIETDAQKVAAWITARRAEGAICKAVLPNYTANNEAVVNFATADIVSSTLSISSATSCSAAEYCARVAGFLAGTPLDQSITYAVLPEVTDIPRLTPTQMDTAIDAGKLILMHDGVKVKFASGVTSLTTVSSGKFAQMKKIKTMEVIDTIRQDLRLLIQDAYIGKLPNTFDNKCLLLTAIRSYFRQLEKENVLMDGSTVGIDIAAQRAYLISAGVDVSEMNDEEIRHANTGSHVFVAASIGVLDAIENIDVNISLDLSV